MYIFIVIIFFLLEHPNLCSLYLFDIGIQSKLNRNYNDLIIIYILGINKKIILNSRTY